MNKCRDEHCLASCYFWGEGETHFLLSLSFFSSQISLERNLSQILWGFLAVSQWFPQGEIKICLCCCCVLLKSGVLGIFFSACGEGSNVIINYFPFQLLRLILYSMCLVNQMSFAIVPWQILGRCTQQIFCLCWVWVFFNSLFIFLLQWNIHESSCLPIIEDRHPLESVCCMLGLPKCFCKCCGRGHSSIIDNVPSQVRRTVPLTEEASAWTYLCAIFTIVQAASLMLLEP